jgi:hypothetical protein
MRRMMLWLVMCLMAAGMVGVYPLHATVPDAVCKALKERFRLSRVAVDNELVEGRVFDPRTILILQADGVPAKRFRVAQHLQLSGFEKSLRPQWTRLHVRDYAPVTIAADGRLTADPGDFALVRGTRLVVLDLKVKADRVHLFIHTLEPVWVTDGKAVYGCTEFIFPLDVSVPERSDPAAILGRIERWLAYGSASQSEWFGFRAHT